MRAFLRIALAAVLAAGIAVASPGAAAAPTPLRRLGAAVAPLRLIARGGGPIDVHGLHPYLGTVEIDSGTGGLVVSNRLPLETYLLGLAEVPSSWPSEALRAQAVAARTYALYTLAQPRAGAAATYGFDICASVQCQVFTGAEKIAAPGGLRWVEAVTSTEGQAILYGGAPILARYHSTSGGYTLENSQAFPGEPSYPYLLPVASPFENAAPLFRWEVTFTLRQMQAILETAGHWEERHGKLVEVFSEPSREGFHYPDVVFRGTKALARLTAEELRDEVRDLAPRMFPGRFPSRSPASGARLPETFPSNRIDVVTEGRRVVVTGRGWGHGAGMSQWGAHGFALRGWNYLQILQHYYSGAAIGPYPQPEDIEVGVDWGRSAVTVSGSFTIQDARGRTLVRQASGTWSFSDRGDGIVAIDPPRGFGLPLRVGIARAPDEVGIGEAAFLTVALSRPATVITQTAGSPTGYRDPGSRIAKAGRERVVWLAPLEPGTYQVQVVARAGPTTRRSEPVEITVVEPEPPPQAEAAGTTTEGDGSAGLPLAAIVALGILGALLVFALSAALVGRMKR